MALWGYFLSIDTIISVSYTHLDVYKRQSYTIPMTVLHACTVGFYLGLKKPLIPSIAQVLEQVFKLASLFIFYVIFTSKGYALTPKVAVFSLILSEIAGTVYCILVVSNYGISFFSKDNFSNIFSKMKMLFNVSYILTLNRILLTFFQSAEDVYKRQGSGLSRVNHLI